MHIQPLGRRLLCGSVVAAAFAAPAHATCVGFNHPPLVRLNEASVQFDGPPPGTMAFSQDCSPVTWSGSTSGPGSTTLEPAGWSYQGAAQASPAAAHVSARSARVGTANPGPDSNVGAEAKSVLAFTLAPRPGAAPGAQYRLQFDVVGEGEMGGGVTPGHLGAASVVLDARSSADSATVLESYSDSNGNTRPRTAGWATGPSVHVDMAIMYLGLFSAGANYFELDLETLVGGDKAFSDFSHTAKIAGITLLTGGVDLILPDGLFVQDSPTHWTLLGATGGGGTGTVPEPASLSLVVAAVALAGWRRRPRDAAAQLLQPLAERSQRA